LALYEPNKAQTGRKRDFQELGVILHSFYKQILPIDLIFNIYWKVFD